MFRFYDPISKNFISDNKNENKYENVVTLSADLQDYKDIIGCCTFEGCKRKCIMFSKNKNRKTCTCTHSLSCHFKINNNNNNNNNNLSQEFIEKRNELLAVYFKPQPTLKSSSQSTSLSENENYSLNQNKTKKSPSSSSSHVKKTKTQMPKKPSLKKTITAITIQKINRERKKENQNNLQTADFDYNFMDTFPQLSDEFYFFQDNCNLFLPTFK
ncbi:hypothetical protein ACTFIV_001356 [Dictyostelium citrinum]